MLYFVVVILAFVLAVIYGKIKKRSFDLFNVKLQKTWLIVVAFALQTVTRLMGVKGFDFAVKFSLLIQVVVFALLFLCFWFNKKYIGLWFIGIGASLNALVMIINGGRMPVSLEAMQKAGIQVATDMVLSGADNKHIVLSDTTRLGFLADIIYLPGILGWGIGVLSIGDIIVALGLFIFVFELCISSMKISNVGHD
ncbi:MAG TPA: DUF5317 domain-containing protein [Acetivibrio sp.]|nr:DUF5317 domain-containing protein [Clostridium sp.]HOQ36752.1 DUF5317 domain-containing protein [Acetivibrio sp.]HPT91938.1 DUF5317 domain-containing protein [Acetivibrio sp.]HQA57684.1 DUF5317 domain-containing protein [Acetivibrio sp.]